MTSKKVSVNDRLYSLEHKFNKLSLKLNGACQEIINLTKVVTEFVPKPTFASSCTSLPPNTTTSSAGKKKRKFIIFRQSSSGKTFLHYYVYNLSFLYITKFNIYLIIKMKSFHP